MDRKTLTTAVLVLGMGAYAGMAHATPPSGFTGTTISLGHYEEIDARISAQPDPHWQAKLKTQGQSDLYVQSNVWAPGGTTGWHSHPGFSLITVTAGAVTAYDGDDPSCTPRVYTVGRCFIDHGGDHAHVLRNEGTVDARTTAVQLVPPGATRRIDVADPGNCPF
jgi:predicted metal-dependent enzyme (double-stranded beta helix superfamily)